MDVREARKALGWSRSDLAAKSGVDPRILQLVELGLSEDPEARARIEATLAEAGAVDVSGVSGGAPGTGARGDS